MKGSGCVSLNAEYVSARFFVQGLNLPGFAHGFCWFPLRQEVLGRSRVTETRAASESPCLCYQMRFGEGARCSLDMGKFYRFFHLFQAFEQDVEVQQSAQVGPGVSSTCWTRGWEPRATACPQRLVGF